MVSCDCGERGCLAGLSSRPAVLSANQDRKLMCDDWQRPSRLEQHNACSRDHDNLLRGLDLSTLLQTINCFTTLTTLTTLIADLPLLHVSCSRFYFNGCCAPFLRACSVAIQSFFNLTLIRAFTGVNQQIINLAVILSGDTVTSLIYIVLRGASGKCGRYSLTFYRFVQLR